VFASTFKSEKSFEVSSASLRNSEVSRVARLQNSNPTTTKKITLGRILKSHSTQRLYSNWMFNSTAMQKGKNPRINAEWFLRRARGLRAGKYFAAMCYWAASRAAQNAHLWLAAKVVSCIGDEGISDWKLPSSALNCCHGGRPEPLGVPDLAKLVQ
jgi:hypothetical protein